MSRNHLVFIFVFTFAILLAVPALAQGGVQAIGACTVIDKPGSYRLARNITAKESDLKDNACIRIVADYVTLDLQGRTIEGPGSPWSDIDPSYGVRVTGVGVQIQNGSVTNFARGVALEGDAHVVDRLRLYTNAIGILFDGDNHRISDAVVSGNWTGILGISGRGNTVEGCQAHDNTGSGISFNLYWDPAFIGSLGNRIVGNTVSGNGEYGIWAPCPSLILQNVAYQNGWGNIAFDGSDCTLADNNPAP